MEELQSNIKRNQEVNDQVRRKLKAKRENNLSVWSGLGMFGLIGWSVVAPMLAGAAIGVWLDNAYPQTFSWTLSGLIVGLLIGCVLAWQWMDKEHKTINNKDDE